MYTLGPGESFGVFSSLSHQSLKVMGEACVIFTLGALAGKYGPQVRVDMLSLVIDEGQHPNPVVE